MKNLTNKTMIAEQLINKMWETVEIIERNLILNTKTIYTNNRTRMVLENRLAHYRALDIEHTKEDIQRYKITLDKTCELQDLVSNFRELVIPNDMERILSMRGMPYYKGYLYHEKEIHSLNNVPNILWSIKSNLYYYDYFKDSSMFTLISEDEYEQYSTFVDLLTTLRDIRTLCKIIEDIVIFAEKRYVEMPDDEDLPF